MSGPLLGFVDRLIQQKLTTCIHGKLTAEEGTRGEASVYACRGFQAGNGWSVAFGRSSGIKLLAVISGDGWLALDEVETPIRVCAGDCLLLPDGRPYRIASDLGLPSINGNHLVACLLPNEVAQFGSGTECFGIAGHFDMAGENGDLLLSMLAPVVHIQEESNKKALRWCLEEMRKELQDPQPGGSLVVQQLGTLMLVQILRTYLTSRVGGHIGWMFALTDRKVGMAYRQCIKYLAVNGLFMVWRNKRVCRGPDSRSDSGSWWELHRSTTLLAGACLWRRSAS